MKDLRFLPYITSCLIVFSMTVSYIWALCLGHVSPVFPSISSTGATPPVSCFFSFTFNIISIFFGIIVWLRHHQVIRYSNPTFQNTLQAKNFPEICKFSEGIGLLAALGLNMVANFQNNNVKYYHFFGAGLAFGVGTLYMAFQSWISMHVPRLSQRWVTILRVCVTIASFLTMLSMTITRLIYEYYNSDYYFKNTVSGNSTTALENHKQMPELLQASGGLEWLVASCVVIYTATFTTEFRYITCKELAIEFHFPDKIRSNSEASV